VKPHVLKHRVASLRQHGYLWTPLQLENEMHMFSKMPVLIRDYSWCELRAEAVCRRCCHHDTSTRHRRPRSSRVSPTRTCASWSTKVLTRTARWERWIWPRTTCSWLAASSSSSVDVDPALDLAHRDRHSTRAQTSVHKQCRTPTYIWGHCYFFAYFMSKLILRLGLLPVQCRTDGVWFT